MPTGHQGSHQRASLPARRNSAGVAVLPSMGSASFIVHVSPSRNILNTASVPDVSPNVSAFSVSVALFEVYARRIHFKWLRTSVARLWIRCVHTERILRL